MRSDIFFSVAVSPGAGMLLLNRGNPLEKDKRVFERVNSLSLPVPQLGLESR
jgi:hypothetical protein